MRILLLANSSFKLANFRVGIIRRLLDDGHDLIAVAPHDAYTQRFAHWGVRFINLPMNATGTSPLAELSLLLRIWGVLRREQPDAVLGYTIKPNIYGALAAQTTGAFFLPNVTGLGSVFDSSGPVKALTIGLYRLALRRCPCVFLQNPDDLALFVKKRIIRKEQAWLLPGSGVDLTCFTATSPKERNSQTTFLLVARMLREKGIEIFAEAANMIGDEFPEARFQLLGPVVEGKASGLSRAEIDRLTASGAVEYLGETEDVRVSIAGADCVVLPSFYREGTPRSLLEAGAMGRAIITTDMPGCRDVVAHGRSGYLCAPRDSGALAEAMRQFLQLSDEARVAMGAASRDRITERFDETIVIEAYLKALAL